MRFSPRIACLTIAAGLLPSSISFAEEAAYVPARIEARRDLELAKVELRHYWQVEYPRLRRQLNAQIELTEAVICDYEERLRAYQPFNRFSTGQPFLITLQELRMCLHDAELRLRDLWAERNALIRFHSDQWRALEMNVYDARIRVAELEASDEAIVEPVAEQPAI
jgi:hypothetical protein